MCGINRDIFQEDYSKISWPVLTLSIFPRFTASKSDF